MLSYFNTATDKAASVLMDGITKANKKCINIVQILTF